VRCRPAGGSFDYASGDLIIKGLQSSRRYEVSPGTPWNSSNLQRRTRKNGGGVALVSLHVFGFVSPEYVQILPDGSKRLIRADSSWKRVGNKTSGVPANLRFYESG
jgi:hypothetical protein